MNIWTEEEIEMIKSGVPDYEVVRRTGRSLRAVDFMKHKILSGEYKPSEIEPMENVRFKPLAYVLTQEEKESRLLDLMAILRVRLG